MAAGNPNDLLNVQITPGQQVSGVVGVEVPGVNGEVDNSGTINGLGVSVLGLPLAGGTNGVQLDQGGTVVNNVNASISGVNSGIDVKAGTGTVNNSGSTTATGTNGIGVDLEAGGTVNNAASGTLSGAGAGVQVGAGAPGTVTNLGTISGTGSTGIGVNLLGGGTLVNAGTVNGTGGVAVNLGGTGGSRLVLDPGSVLNGSAHAAGTGNVLELAAGPMAGTLADIGTTVQGFGSTVVDPNATFTVTGGISAPGTVSLGDGAALTIEGPVAAGVDVDLGGTNAKLTLGDPSGFQGTLSNLGPGDIVALDGLGANATVTLNPGGTALTVKAANGSTSVVPVTLAAGLDPATVSLSLGTDADGSLTATIGTGTTAGGGAGAGTGTGSGTGAGGSTAQSPPTIGGGTTTGGATSGGPNSDTGSPPAIPATIGGTPTNINTPTVSGTTAPGSLVTLYDTDGKTVLGSGTADPTSGAFSIRSSPLADGMHTLTATDTVDGHTSASSAGVQFDIDTHGPQIAFDPQVNFHGRTTATLSGSVSDISGITSVEVYAGNVQGAVDIGAATINPDGSWSIVDNPGSAFQTDIHAVATDGAGNTSSTQSYYDLTTGVKGQPYTAVQDRYDPVTGAFVGETFFNRRGAEIYDNTLEQLPNGSLRYTYQNGTFFNNKDYNAFQDTYDANGDIRLHTTNNNDGTHTSYGEADRVTIRGFGNDTMSGNGRNETFVFHPGLGQELVTDFAPGGAGHDVIQLLHTGMHNLAEALQHTTMSNGDAVIHVGDTSITLTGVTKAELKDHPSDFKFHA